MRRRENVENESVAYVCVSMYVYKICVRVGAISRMETNNNNNKDDYDDDDDDSDGWVRERGTCVWH